MSINPYEPPQGISVEAPSDPLGWPALGCLVGSVAGMAWAAGMAGLAVYFLRMADELETPRLLQEGRDLLLAAGCLVLLCLLAAAAGYSIRHRRRRWLVVAAVVIGLTPFAMFAIPLAAIIAMRLRRPEVWNSFN